MAVNESPRLEHVLAGALRARLADLHVGMPGRVVRYDSAKQCADVQPLIKRRRRDEGGELVAEPLAVLNEVPVIFSGGGGFSETFPMAVGDDVWIEFAECSLDKWKPRGGSVDPEDDRRFTLSDAVCYPGLRDLGHPRSSAPTDRARFGKDGGVALEVTSTEVLVGGGVAPHEPTLKATTYRAAEDVYLGLIATALALLAADPTFVAQAATKSALAACGTLTGFAAFQGAAAAAPTLVAKVR